MEILGMMIENKTIEEEIEQWMENHRAAVLIFDASIEDWEKNHYLEQRERSCWIKRGKKISRNADGDEEERREAERRKEERRCQVSKFSYLKELVITKVSLWLIVCLLPAKFAREQKILLWLSTENQVNPNAHVQIIMSLPQINNANPKKFMSFQKNYYVVCKY